MSDSSSRIATAKISRLLWDFSLPAIVGMLVSSLYNIIDRVFIGHAVGSLGIAAVTVCFPVMLVQMAIGVLVGMGATTLVSIRLGEQRRDEAEHIVGNAFTLVMALAAITTTLGLVFLGPILRASGASPEIFPYAYDFLRIILLGSPFIHAAMGMNSFIRAEGRPAKAMATMLIGTVMNLLLAPLFLFVFHMGMKGAALATLLAQLSSFLWVMSHFLSRTGLLKLRLRHLVPDFAVARMILANGMAPFLLQLAVSVQNLVMNKSLAHYGGDFALSGMGAVSSVLVILVMPVIGVSQGAQPIIGYNYGAGRLDRVKQATLQALLFAFTLSSIGYLVTRIFPVELISLFNASDREMVRFGSHALTLAFIFAPVVSLQTIAGAYFQALGRVRLSMLLGLSRQVLYFIPLMLLLPLRYGLEGVLYAFPTADALSAITASIFLLVEFRRLDRQIKNDEAAPSLEALETENAQL